MKECETCGEEKDSLRETILLDSKSKEERVNVCDECYNEIIEVNEMQKQEK